MDISKGGIVKKILYVLIALFSILVFTDEVSAKVCKYSDGKRSLTVTIENDSINYDFVKSSEDTGNVTSNSNLKISDFSKDSNGEYICLNQIKYVINEIAYSNTKSFVFSANGGSKTFNLINNPNDNSENNDKENNTNNESNNDGNNLTCVYSDDRIQVTVKIKDGVLQTIDENNNFKELIVGDAGLNRVTSKLKTSDFENNGNYKCLDRITYILVEAPESAASQADTYTIAVSGYANMLKLNNNATGSDNGESDSSNNDYIDDNVFSNIDSNINWTGCDVITKDMRTWLNQVLDLIKMIGLILAIVLGMVDFFKAMSSGESDAMKKAWKAFANRLIAVVILFLLPLVIEFVLGLITINGIDPSSPLCGIK